MDTTIIRLLRLTSIFRGGGKITNVRHVCASVLVEKDASCEKLFKHCKQKIIIKCGNKKFKRQTKNPLLQFGCEASFSWTTGKSNAWVWLLLSRVFSGIFYGMQLNWYVRQINKWIENVACQWIAGEKLALCIQLALITFLVLVHFLGAFITFDKIIEHGLAVSRRIEKTFRNDSPKTKPT